MTYRRSYHLFTLVFLACMISIGCGGGTQSPGSSVPSSSTNSSSSSNSSGTSTPAPAVMVTPASYTFNSQVLNSSSTPETITLTNTGNANLSLARVTVTGDFTLTNNCGTTLAAGANCMVSVTFTPTAAGTRTGTVSFSDNAAQSPQIVSLSGSGVTAGQLVDSPSSIAFGNVTIGQIASQTVTITNTSGQKISVTSVIRVARESE